ncbi:hypothetical protein IBB38_01665 [Listeria seeligeri]|uniref:hypothetical protein n=1 Tax=Listeria seeligeri TaxID=1640 RepID=UPI001624E323|nr:hypothetical protein [Listeria seeligeri]MBC2017027.1 hypothetical protein [Listeria seeligeri]MBF2551634.1 hypothetical protein [Listeria seeligeri]MBF2618138.1 hypothetical protein [Listeria seeligeri]MBF2623643.1 hypothetical protein [Listeria seeligeri]
MFMKQNGAKRDVGGQPPHQKRWTTIGTTTGDMIQRDLLFIEKHFKAKTGKNPPFVFEKNVDGTPMFEDFAKKCTPVSYKNHRFNLYGTCDGIMLYTDSDGKQYRVGLEIKSKQTTYSKTSDYSMREADEKHVKQTVAYSHMYRDPNTGAPLDYYLILYVNLSKKNWFQTFKEAPDLKCFGIFIDDNDRNQLFDYFAEVLDAVEQRQAPPFEIDTWTFNNFKDATAKYLTNEEVAEVRAYVRRVKASSQPDYIKTQLIDAYEDLVERRNGNGTK